jgi:glyoxylase-like metal-dependent hydrolase (beta-lactamase superfamily II)
MAIPYVRQFDFAYGRPDVVSPLIRRVIADNPGPFTFTGTGTYIVGHGRVAVIDPGPDDDRHLQALLRALRGETVEVILTTHDHADHAPLAARLKAETGAPVVGCRPSPHLEDGGPKSDEDTDAGYAPDRVVEDGETLSGPGWTLKALATPGHTSNHVCYALEEENALFSGDHVMGWSTTVVSPPDGDMGDYYRSLERVRAGGFSTLWPTHGPPVTDVSPFLDAYAAHRRDREAQILSEIAAGHDRIADMVPIIYAAVTPTLHPAAARSVLAHLIELVRTGRVATEGAAGLESRYRVIG